MGPEIREALSTVRFGQDSGGEREREPWVPCEGQQGDQRQTYKQRLIEARNKRGLVKSYDLERTLVVREREREREHWVPCEGQQGDPRHTDTHTDIHACETSK